MKILIENNEGYIWAKCYVPKTEVRLYTNQEDETKDYRKQKTYKIPYTNKKAELLEMMLTEVFSNYHLYSKIHMESITSGNGIDMVKKTLVYRFPFVIESYGRDIFEPVYKILKAFVFENNEYNMVENIKERYKLNSNRDLLVTFIGAFRYGKTTLIKKIMGLGEDFIFPLVDNGRTSINNCLFRGLFVRKSKEYGDYISVKDDLTGKKEYIPMKEYGFYNRISLKNCTKVFENDILSNVYEAFEVYCKERYSVNESEESGIKNTWKKRVLESFIKQDTARFDEIFGDIDDYFNETQIYHDKVYNFYDELMKLFSDVYSNINENIEFHNSELQIPAIYKEFIIKNYDFQEFTVKYLHQKIWDEVENMRSVDRQKEVNYDDAHGIIDFKLSYDEIESIDDYYEYFVSNNSSQRGKLLRLLVDEIYTEFDLHLHRFFEEKEIKCFSNLDSMIFADTMGAGHKSDKNEKGMDSSNDIINNSALLSSSDIIVLLDDASQSMKKTTLEQIKTISNIGLSEKLILAYSWYDYFVKRDMKNDHEREMCLFHILRDKLKETFADMSSEADRIYKSLIGRQRVLECGIYEYNDVLKDEPARIVFLKGLVPYNFKTEHIHESQTEHTNTLQTRKKRGGAKGSTHQEEDFIKSLNSGNEFGEIPCIKNLILKIVVQNAYINSMRMQSSRINSNIADEYFMCCFFQAYDKFYNEYIMLQHDEYIIMPPHYKTTEALCRRLSYGGTYFYGQNRALNPYNDAVSVLMKNMSRFIENYFRVEVSDGDENFKSFIINEIKLDFSKRISRYIYTLMITSNKPYWKQCSMDWGIDVRERRARIIYNTLDKSMKTDTSISETSNSVDVYSIFKISVKYIIELFKKK